MRTSRSTDSQILAFLKQNEEGSKVPDLCGEHGFSAAHFYKWQSNFGGMDPSLKKRTGVLRRGTLKKISKTIFVKKSYKSSNALSTERDSAESIET